MALKGDGDCWGLQGGMLIIGMGLGAQTVHAGEEYILGTFILGK